MIFVFAVHAVDLDVAIGFLSELCNRSGLPAAIACFLGQLVGQLVFAVQALAPSMAIGFLSELCNRLVVPAACARFLGNFAFEAPCSAASVLVPPEVFLR